MADIKPFVCVRPAEDVVSAVAALPYDVYNREEAKEVVAKNPKSFLAIDRAETQFPDDVDTYDDRVYAKAAQMLKDWIADGTFIRDNRECYYIYELTMDGRTQTGIAACASIDDYANQVIKKHENTRADKEQDRIRHVDTCSAQTGPIFLAYRANAVINEVVAKTKKQDALYDFVAELFDVQKIENGNDVRPVKKGQFSMFLSDKWYRCTMRPESVPEDPVEGLDVSVLQNVLLAPVLGIGDPKTDKRIDFVGGIRGMKELERRCHEDCKVAFAMYPTSIQELFAVADAGRLMPPKSTWFEPKLRSGLFIHEI